jgi:ABC-type Zn uptake system ZnuABC Zn-binding protein ZnuA
MTGSPDERNQPPAPKPSREEDFRQNLKEYADELREIIRKLRRYLS